MQLFRNTITIASFLCIKVIQKHLKRKLKHIYISDIKHFIHHSPLNTLK